MTEAKYREALLLCADRYLEMSEPSELQDFIVEFRDKITGDDPYPLLKLNRWLGYIQGVLIERKATTVEDERNWTRPLFRPLDFA